MTERTNSKTHFTLIYWQVLDTLNLSVAEYILLDTIYGLSLKTGWCYASRAELGRSVRMTRRWVFDTLESLSKRGLVEYQLQTRHLRCSRQWMVAVAEKRFSKGQSYPSPTDPMPAPENAGEKSASLCNSCTSEQIAPVQKVHSPGEKTAVEVVQTMHRDGEKFAPNTNNYNTTKTIQKPNTEKGAYAPSVFSDPLINDSNPLPDELALQESLLPDEKKRTQVTEEAAMFSWETPVVNPPPVAPVPSLAKSGKADKAQTDCCLVACRQVYWHAFPEYSWQYGRDDKLLKGVLAQIRAKIVRQTGEAHASDEYVIHSFESFLARIPDWYRRNGHTTPADLNRHFEKHYAAIKAGQGGGSSSHLAPTTDRDREYLELMQRLTEG